MDSTLGGSSFTSQGHFASPVPMDDRPRGRSGEACSSEAPAQMSALAAENRQLRADLEQLRAEKAKMAETLSRLAEVLGSKSTDRLVHDLRNVLNERELYRALADSVM